MSKRYVIKSFIKNNVVLLIATVCAIISCFFVTPDAQYIEYFDFSTLVCLLGMSVVISALKNIKFFRILARKIIGLFKTTRSAITALVVITYVASMLIANDMALITFLPLGYFVLHSAQKEEYMAYTFTMQTISANLGGMLTPFGNPQNLYLYNYFSIAPSEFFAIMILPTLFAVALIAVCCIVIRSEKITAVEDMEETLNKPRAIIYFILFAYMIVLVFRVVPYWTGLFVIPVILVMDRKALLKVDYALLLTFCAFFVFTGNLARIPEVDAFFRSLLEWNVMLTGVLSCQIISNVPSAALLSGFTQNYSALLVAVNIGGCGTLISSMASLISYKSFSLYRPKEKLKYLLLNGALNFGFLIILTLLCLFVL
ncbi:MAG: citrate transporter [Clostridia bacterium]|nr:citrate transporter [Clostridia bacterium]